MSNGDELAFGEMKRAGDVSLTTGGLTKREYFEAMAMQGLCTFHGDGQKFAVTVYESLEIADKLLEALGS